MLRGFRIGQALGTMAVACAAAAFAVPAGAQKAAAHTDTTHAAKASDDTVFQSEGMQEFEARRKRGAGYFMTHDQLRRNLDRPLGEIVATHFPGLRMVYGPHLDSQYLVSLRDEGVRPLALLRAGVRGRDVHHRRGHQLDQPERRRRPRVLRCDANAPGVSPPRRSVRRPAGLVTDWRRELTPPASAGRSPRGGGATSVRMWDAQSHIRTRGSNLLAPPGV